MPRWWSYSYLLRLPLGISMTASTQPRAPCSAMCHDVLQMMYLGYVAVRDRGMLAVEQACDIQAEAWQQRRGEGLAVPQRRCAGCRPDLDSARGVIDDP